MSDPLVFTLAVIAVLSTPGPTNTLLLTSGATIGARRSMPLLLAEVAGYGVSVAAASVAAGLISSAVPAAHALISVLVGAYLIVLAVTMWRRVVADATRVVLWRHVFVTTLLNPKVLVFAFAIIPQGKPDSALYFAAFVAIVPLIGTMWIVLGALPRARWGGFVQKVVPRMGAVVVACFAFFVIATSLQQIHP